MGMLFNTPATIDIIKKLNSHFDGTTDRSGDIAELIKIATGGRGHARDVAAALGLTPNDAYQVHGRSAPSANWIAWLDLLDLHDNSKDSGNKCSATVGNRITAALNINGKAVIEFFAVPDHNDTGYISVEATNVMDGGHLVSLCITVYTMTFDQLQNQPHP
jgi:hypothetical protein